MNSDLEQFSEEELTEIIKDCTGEIYNTPTSDETTVSPRILLSLARIALAAKKAKPVAWITWHQGCRAPDDCEDYLDAYTYKTEEKSVDGSDAFPVYTTPQPAHTEQAKSAANEFLPENLDRALTIMGVALPESKEEFNFQAKRWTQRLIDRVIRFGSELQTEVNSAEIPDGWKLVPIEPTYEMKLQVHPIAVGTCHNCGCEVNPDCEDNVLLSWQDMLAAAPKPESEQ